jgi:hypothetical protein
MPNATARANARTLSSATTPADPGDPIFAAIEAHRAAWAPYEAALNRTARLVGPPPQVLEDAKNAAEAAEMAVAKDLFATTPTTLAGLGELLRYAAEMDPGSVPDGPQAFIAFVAALARSPVFSQTATRVKD